MVFVNVDGSVKNMFNYKVNIQIDS